MRALWIAIGVGITAYCFITHQPTWLCIANVVFDVALILEYLKSK